MSLNVQSKAIPQQRCICWLHSWWCFRAQTSALQQAIPFFWEFLGAANRDATTTPPMTIRRNTSTLNGTFTGDRRSTSSVVSTDARRGDDIARTCESEWSHGTAATVLSAVRLTHSSALRHTDRLLLRLALARLTFSRMSLAFAVQIKGLG